MAIRRRAVRPDTVLETANGPIAHVSDDAFYRAVMDAATTIQLAGGQMTVIVQRAPTEVDGESVTVGALIEWKDHRSAKAQPEPAARPAPAAAAPAPTLAAQMEAMAQEAGAVTGEAEPTVSASVADAPETEDGLDDGFDRSTLEDEDVSEIPEAVR